MPARHSFVIYLFCYSCRGLLKTEKENVLYNLLQQSHPLSLWWPWFSVQRRACAAEDKGPKQNRLMASIGSDATAQPLK